MIWGIPFPHFFLPHIIHIQHRRKENDVARTVNIQALQLLCMVGQKGTLHEKWYTPFCQEYIISAENCGK